MVTHRPELVRLSSREKALDGARRMLLPGFFTRVSKPPRKVVAAMPIRVPESFRTRRAAGSSGNNPVGG